MPGAVKELPTTEFAEFAAHMNRYQVQRDAAMAMDRQRRQQQAAIAAARQYGGCGLPQDNESSMSAVTPGSDDALVCAIWRENAVKGEAVAPLTCQHAYNQTCITTWTNIAFSNAACPQC